MDACHGCQLFAERKQLFEVGKEAHQDARLELEGVVVVPGPSTDLVVDIGDVSPDGAGCGMEHDPSRLAGCSARRCRRVVRRGSRSAWAVVDKLNDEASVVVWDAG